MWRASLLLTLNYLLLHKINAFHFPTPTQHIRNKINLSSTLATTNEEKDRKVNILLCPAQFCVPDDYTSLFTTLKSHFSTSQTTISTCTVAPLPRTEWIKVARQLPTSKFWKANLDVKETLGWYFDAIENGLSEILEKEGEDAEICVIGHSIGGWVARAYLGGLSGSSTAVYNLGRECVKSFVTLGTPHLNPDGALVDQTRGLLNQVCNSEQCTSQSLHDRGIKITCVGSTSIPGSIFTTKIDEIVAATSYIPLTGSFIKEDLVGDGIVPSSISFMEHPANRICIEDRVVRHSHVLPTPWNLWDGYEGSIVLPEEYGVWYGSEDVLKEWADSII